MLARNSDKEKVDNMKEAKPTIRQGSLSLERNLDGEAGVEWNGETESLY